MTGGEGEAPRTAGVDGRVLEILSERSGRIAFNGLRRALGVHPESLTRALRRLARAGTVTRTEGGYALTEPALKGSRSGNPPRTVASIQLPPGALAEDILGRLAGRWFGSLRWVGIHEHPGDPWLVWSTERGHAHFMLAIQRGSLRVLTDLPAGGVGTEDGAAYELLAQAVERIRSVASRSDSSVLTLEAGSPPSVRYAS
ncbi:MAG: hypothetical protein WAN74_02830 [Thermoplasmata archaeon]